MGALSVSWGRSQKYLKAEQANLYALAHAQGICENQRRESEEKRVFNLTRSGYAGSQKYGAVLWSGDTSATWETLRKQIREGLNMCMSGMPYWTLDAGAFLLSGNIGGNVVPTPTSAMICGGTGKGLRRWRSRYGVPGTVCALAGVCCVSAGVSLPWNGYAPGDLEFWKRGRAFYDAIAQTIRLRYRLMPYIYSMAGKVYCQDYTMMRSLLFDFPEDSHAKI